MTPESRPATAEWRRALSSGRAALIPVLCLLVSVISIPAYAQGPAAPSPSGPGPRVQPGAGGAPQKGAEPPPAPGAAKAPPPGGILDFIEKEKPGGRGEQPPEFDVHGQAAGEYPPMDRDLVPLGRIQKAWNRAGTAPAPGQEAPGISRYVWTPASVFKIDTRVFMVTTIVLPPWETALQLHLGDPVSFKAAQPVGNVIRLSSNHPGGDTNLVVIGSSGRVYPFYIRSTGVDSKTVSDFVVYVEGLNPNATPPEFEAPQIIGERVTGSESGIRAPEARPGDRAPGPASGGRDARSGKDRSDARDPRGGPIPGLDPGTGPPPNAPAGGSWAASMREPRAVAAAFAPDATASRMRPPGGFTPAKEGVPRSRAGNTWRAQEGATDWLRDIPFDINKLRFDEYRMEKGGAKDSDKIAPDRVFHDGVFTYLYYARGRMDVVHRPVVHLVIDQVDNPVNTRTGGPHGNIIVVEAVGDMTLRNGERVICLRYLGDVHRPSGPDTDPVFDRKAESVLGRPASGGPSIARAGARDPEERRDRSLVALAVPADRQRDAAPGGPSGMTRRAWMDSPQGSRWTDAPLGAHWTESPYGTRWTDSPQDARWAGTRPWTAAQAGTPIPDPGARK